MEPRVIFAVCKECIQHGGQATIVALPYNTVALDRFYVWCAIHRRTEGVQVSPPR